MLKSSPDPPEFGHWSKIRSDAPVETIRTWLCITGRCCNRLFRNRRATTLRMNLWLCWRDVVATADHACIERYCEVKMMSGGTAQRLLNKPVN